jgi:hypothetical protein
LAGDPIQPKGTMFTALAIASASLEKQIDHTPASHRSVDLSTDERARSDGQVKIAAKFPVAASPRSGRAKCPWRIRREEP